MTKRRYHHGNLRRVLIDAGTDLIAKSGVDGFNMRELARRAGVSSAAPYRHFADKDALLAAIATDGFVELGAQMREVARDSTDPSAGFRRQGMAFTEFAIANPAHFRAMYLPRLHDAKRFPELVNESQNATRLLYEQIVMAQQAGLVAPFDVQHIALAALALVYGTARLFVDGVLDGSNPALAQHVVAAVIEIMGKGIAPRDNAGDLGQQTVDTIPANLMPSAPPDVSLADVECDQDS